MHDKKRGPNKKTKNGKARQPYAFVQYVKEDAAHQALKLNGHSVGGKKLVVQKFKRTKSNHQ